MSNIVIADLNPSEINEVVDCQAIVGGGYYKPPSKFSLNDNEIENSVVIVVNDSEVKNSFNFKYK